VAFDLTRRRPGVDSPTSGVELEGDVVVALWARDHASRLEPPMAAYAFHTAFVDPRDGRGGGGALRVPARHLDVPGTSRSELVSGDALCGGML